MRAAWLIARTVLLEAVRRKEIYAIVLIACALIVAAGSTRFFSIASLDKFYREVAMQIMNLATALTVVVLAARQLPREFDKRTIYPLLAKPVNRITFLLGKYLGVVLAGAFCYGLFLAFYLVGVWQLHASMDWGLFFQCIYLQMLALCILAALAFALSLLFNIDAAITISALLFGLGQTFTMALDYIYDYVPPLAQSGLLFVNFAVPQFTLFDLTAKLVHSDVWDPIPGWVVWTLSAYALAFMLLYLGAAYAMFRRRSI